MSVGNEEPTSAYPFMPLMSTEFWKVKTINNYLPCIAQKRSQSVKTYGPQYTYEYYQIVLYFW